MEEGNVFGKADTSKLLLESKNLYKIFDSERVMNYINEEFRSTYKSKYGGYNSGKKRQDERRLRDENFRPIQVTGTATESPDTAGSVSTATATAMGGASGGGGMGGGGSGGY